MESNKISIIVPVYNVECYLERCLNNLINQTYKNIEIILVDDGSTDNCSFICDEYAQKKENIVVIHKINGGLSNARNSGLSKATGDYILYVDSDDFIELNSCEKLIKAMNNNIDLVVGAYKEINNGTIVEKRHNNLLENRLYTAKEYVVSSIEANEWYAPAWLNLYRKSFLINNNLYFKDGFYFEDIEMLPRLFLANPNVEYVDYAFYNYVIREDSIMTSRATPEKIRMLSDIYSNWFKLFSNVDDESYRMSLYGILVKYYIATARQKEFIGWKVQGLDFAFAWKYSLNFKEKIKSILFNFFPKHYIKISNKRIK